ncbi:hypothetical protein ARMGADRAFT_1084179 [Armillaria gallica]|uniref:Uncharacterized protein n=1 Tax=Armillaria gallica TaxID=47427 RepID=A0A2H3DNU1_ARMGA|nr:hypothetical protein ARMGADRAFT_1084179 [Armillaria gallica]
MVCGTDGPLVDSGCVNSLFDVLSGTNQRRDVGRLVFIAHSFIDNHREVEHTFIDHTRLATGHYHRPAKHANEDYPFILQDSDYMIFLPDDDIPSILSNNCYFADVFYKRESTVDILHNRALLVQSPIVLGTRACLLSPAMDTYSDFSPDRVLIFEERRSFRGVRRSNERPACLLVGPSHSGTSSRLQRQTQCEAYKLPLHLLADLEAAAPSLSLVLILLLLLVPQLSALDGTEVTTALETDESNETLDPESLGVRLRVLGLLSRRIT